MIISLFLKALEAFNAEDDDILEEQQQQPVDSNTHHTNLNADTDDLIKVLSDKHQQLLPSKDRNNKISFYEKAILSLKAQAELFPEDEISEETRLSQEKINAAIKTYEHLLAFEIKAKKQIDDLVQQQQQQQNIVAETKEEYEANEISDEIQAKLHKLFYEIAHEELYTLGGWFKRNDSSLHLQQKSPSDAEYLKSARDKARTEPKSKTAAALKYMEAYIASSSYDPNASKPTLKVWRDNLKPNISVVNNSVFAAVGAVPKKDEQVANSHLKAN